MGWGSYGKGEGCGIYNRITTIKFDRADDGGKDDRS